MKKTKKKQVCGRCNQPDHNARTCTVTVRQSPADFEKTVKSASTNEASRLQKIADRLNEPDGDYEAKLADAKFEASMGLRKRLFECLSTGSDDILSVSVFQDMHEVRCVGMSASPGFVTVSTIEGDGNQFDSVYLHGREALLTLQKFIEIALDADRRTT